MPDLIDLYKNVIIDHFKKPRNFHKLDRLNRQSDGFNHLCGDKISVYLLVEDGMILDISFTGSCCAIATASASMMTEIIKGKPESAAKIFINNFHDLIKNCSVSTACLTDLGQLVVFAGLHEYPVRAKCATLAWNAMSSALESGS